MTRYRKGSNTDKFALLRNIRCLVDDSAQQTDEGRGKLR